MLELGGWVVFVGFLVDVDHLFDGVLVGYFQFGDLDG